MVDAQDAPPKTNAAKAAKAAKASQPWWLEESALTAAHLLTSTQLDAAIRTGTIKTLERKPTSVVAIEHTTASTTAAAAAAAPATSTLAAGGAQAMSKAVKVGSAGFALCQHQVHALNMVPPLGPSRAVAHVAASLSADDFYWDYIIRGRPVVIGKGLLDNW